MQKDYKLYIDDILKSVGKIEEYTKNLSYEDFASDSLIVDAVVRNLEIIGEAIKNIPPEIKKKNPEIEWKKIVGLRDILIHAYFGIDLEIVWDIIKNKMPQLKASIMEME